MISDFLLQADRCRSQQELHDIAAAVLGVGSNPEAAAFILSNLVHENTILREVLEHEQGNESTSPFILDICDKRAQLAQAPGLSFGQSSGCGWQRQ